MQFKVVTQSDDYNDGKPKEHIFEFVKNKPREGDYGNKLYVSVMRGGSEFAYLDARYDKRAAADFAEYCKAYLQEYFGENLKSCEIIEG